jgi:hypothetical protein
MKNLTEQLKERIPTIEAGYQETGYPKVDFSVYPEKIRANRQSEYDAIVLFEAARKIELENNPEEIDWSTSQPKWAPYFWMSPSGFAFDDSYFVFAHAFAGSGSRLRVLRRETSDYLGMNFLEMWKNIQLK